MPTLLAYTLLFTVIGAFFIFIHLVIGRAVRPMRPDAEKLTVYECGEPTIGSAWVQFDLRFYVVALLFVIFDVEVAFFFPWAVVFGRANQLAGNSIATQQRVSTMKMLDPNGSIEGLNSLTDDAVHAEDVSRKAEAHRKRIEDFERRIEESKPRLKELHDKREKVEAEIAALPPEPPANTPQHTAWLAQRSPLDSQISAYTNDEFQLNALPGRLEALRERGPEPSVREQMTGRVQSASHRFAWVAFLDILVFFAVLLVGFAYLWRRGDLEWVRSVAGQRGVVRPVAAKASEPVLALLDE